MTDLKAAADAAKAAYDATREASRAIERRRDAAVWAAREEINARFAPEVKAAGDAAQAAYTAWIAADNAAVVDHEWEGKIVERTDWEQERWNGKRIAGTEFLVRGIVETARHRSDMGPGHGCHDYNVGVVFVRLLKKDGKVGARCEKFNERAAGRFNDPERCWRLAVAS
jgi:hypothetical protein